MALRCDINPCQVLVQPRKTRPDITENCRLGREESDQTKEAVEAVKTTYIWGKITKESSLSKKKYLHLAVVDNTPVTSFLEILRAEI